MNEDAFEFHERSFDQLRERLLRVLGTPTVNTLIERSTIEIGKAHPAVAALRCKDDSIDFSGMREALSGASPEEVRDAFTALNGVLLLLVARLLGREIAARLTEGVTIEEFLEPRGAK
jgi:hypothetical protein